MSVTTSEAHTSSAPSSKGRAVTSVALLVGFYVLGLLVILACVAALWAMVQVGRFQLGIVVACFAVPFAVVKGFLTAGGKFTGIPGSIRVEAADQPELIAMVSDVAAAMGTEIPDEIYLVDDVNAFVLEDTRLMGLVTHKRVMGIGLALVNRLTVDELRGVIAHEFGHYAGGDTRLSAIVYRGRQSIFRTLETLRGGVVHAVYVAYFKLFLRTSMGVSRRQELSADRWSVVVAGTEPTVATQERLGALGAAYASFVDRYVHGLWVQGHRPVNQFDGFDKMIEHPGNGDALATAAANSLAAASDPYDSHPAAAERIANIQAMDFVREHGDRRPARELLRNAAALEVALTAAYQRAAWTGDALAPVDWDAAGEVFGASLDGAATVLRESTGASTAGAAIASAVQLISADRTSFSADVARRLGSADQPDAATQVSLAAGIGTALVEAGSHRWAVSWTGPSNVEPIGAQPAVDIWELADRAGSGDHAALDEVRRLCAPEASTTSPAGTWSPPVAPSP